MAENPIRILLTEDNPGYARLIGKMLEQAGESCFCLKHANSLASGLELAAGGGFDLLILDLMLPDSEGLDTFVRARQGAPGMPIVVLTSLRDETLALEALRQGAQDYLVKSMVDSNLLARSLRYAIERKRIERALRETRDELERRVEERTRDLQVEIAERKSAEAELKASTQKLRRAMEGAIQAMAVTVEMRDLYTAGHQKRVAELSVAIARTLELAPERIEGLHFAAVIHDIGKICTPAEILSKPATLTPVEYSLIKNHPQTSYNILKNVDFPWPVANIVLQHHERLDGSGYPGGLSGAAIIMEARVLAVADVVEAMSSHRPYRPALGMDRALEEIARHQGTLYDPRVVAACLRLCREGGFKFSHGLDDNGN